MYSRPIIFVCHSLGGLVVKQVRESVSDVSSCLSKPPLQALLTANLNRRFSSIRHSTSAIVFFGTPHRGGNGATFGQFAVNVVRLFTNSVRNDLVNSLQKSSPFLAHLTADFKHIYEDFNYLSILETRGILKTPPRMVCRQLYFRDAANSRSVGCRHGLR